MSDYTKSTNFATKDNLTPGDPLKIVRGTEIDTEFNNIATAISTKTDNSAAAITGGSITGITDLAIADGGTGASTATAAINNLLPSQTSNANKYLQTDGTNVSWDAVSLSTSDITGTLPVSNGGTGVTSSTGTGSVVLSNSPTLVTPALGTPASGTLTNATGLPISTGVSGLGTGVATFLGTPSSANLASAVSDETGSGALVFANSPTLVTPALGTPASATLTNATGLPIGTGVSGLGTGVATALAVNVGSAGAPVVNGGALGTPSSGTVTNLTGTASININGTVGATTPTTGAFTTLTTSSTVTLNGGTANGLAYLNASKVLTSGSALTFDSFNRLGIQVTPISTGANGDDLQIGDPTTNVGAGLTIGSTTTADIQFSDAISGTGQYAGILRYSHSNDSMQFWTASSEQMRLNSTGLGIGTSSPTNKLTVDGNANITGNTTLGDASTDSVQVNGYMGVGGAGSSNIGLYVRNTALTGTTQYGVSSTVTGNSAATANVIAIEGAAKTAAETFTSANVQAFYASDATKGAGSTITNQHGIRILDQTQGTNNYGITSLVSSGTNKFNIYASGTAQNYFAGNVGIGTTSPSYKLTVAGTSGTAVVSLLETGVRSWGIRAGGAVTNTFDIADFTAGVTRLTLDSAGNLGLGVTPSAWGSGYKALDIQYLGISNTGAGTVDCSFTQNGYYNGTNWIAKYTSPSKRYSISDSGFIWYNGASATAGNAISFTQAMTLDASGNLGIGTSSPASKLDVSSSSGNNAIISRSTTATNASVQIAGNGNTAGSTSFDLIQDNTYAYVYQRDSKPLVFGTSNTERARIDSSGNLLVGDTTSGTVRLRVTNSASDDIALFKNSNATPYGVNVSFSGASPNNTSSYFYTCADSGPTTRFKVYSNGGIANYSANNVNLSDQRVKTDIQDAGGYLAKICAIPVRTFKYKDQTDDLSNLGVIAQEVEAVAPELVDTTGFGEMPEDGVPLKAIYQTDLQYALMKALQELKAEFDAYKASHP